MDGPERLHAAALALRAFFLAASILVLVIQAVPALRSRFLAYGSRATSPSEQPATSKSRQPASKNVLEKVLDHAASVQVPHRWFTHFYLVSVACSLFWGWSLQLWNVKRPLQIVWGLMLLQGVRRMLESYTYTSTSKSKMWFGHWILGLLFYLAINVSVWVEGLGDTSAPEGLSRGGRRMVLLPAILTAHALQHTYHAYLYRLRTQNTGYQLPSHPLFPSLICPHYTCEIAIYALLSLIAAPSSRLVNWTLVSGTVFVLTNLGVTATGTKEWYEEKFGEDKVGRRTKMIPWIW